MNAEEADYFLVPMLAGCIQVRADENPNMDMQVRRATVQYFPGGYLCTVVSMGPVPPSLHHCTVYRSPVHCIAAYLCTCVPLYSVRHCTVTVQCCTVSLYCMQVKSLGSRSSMAASSLRASTGVH